MFAVLLSCYKQMIHMKQDSKSTTTFENKNVLYTLVVACMLENSKIV